MKSCLAFVWRWSWVITLPIVCVFMCWGWFTAERFYTFGIRYNSAPLPYHLHGTGVKEFLSLSRNADLAISGLWAPKHNNSDVLKVVNLFVPEGSLAELNSKLPHSGYKYVKGRLWNGDNLQKIKFKYRGDFIYHWGDQKKSLRVKTSKKNLYRGARTFNLIAPKQLNTHFGCLLAKDMGLIAPSTDLVEVVLNGKLLGVHAYVEQLEELTLRENGRMPGDIYAGELLGKDSYTGTDHQLFIHPQLWEKVAINNHYDDESRRPLEKLLSLINSRNPEQAQKELTELLDVQAWGAMAAFETLTQSFHYDNTHNWRLYYDPMKSRFYPVVWDPVGWHPDWVPQNDSEAQLDIMQSVMHQFIYKNASILRAKSQALQGFFKNGKDKHFLQKVEKTLPGLKAALKRDPLLTQPPDTEIAKIDNFTDSIKKIFSDVKREYLEHKETLKYSFVNQTSTDFIMGLSVSGRVPVSTLSLRFANAFDRPITGRLVYTVNGKKIEKDISGAISVNGSAIEIRKTLIASYKPIKEWNSGLRESGLQTEPAYYELVLNGLIPTNRLIDVRVDYDDGEMVAAEYSSSLRKTSFANLYNIVDFQPIEVPIIWKGIVDIYGVKEISRPLIVEPGTMVRFSPGASLILENQLLAEGTAENPISFVPMNKGNEPWGTVTIKGSRANGSRLKYCQFEGGSGLKSGLFEYTAMFSIHDVKDVAIENCKFRDSKITDDMVHAVYSEVHFSDCLFERSLMDALDIDISEAVVERCRFIDSGNDAIDLMTSNVVVLDTLIVSGGDKATSVGEGSHLLAINNLFKNNVIGVQVKDGSVASLYNTDLEGNGHALDAYKKNWRYGDGGEIYFYKGRFVNNNQMITADKKSKIRVFDSYMDRVVTSTKKVKIDTTVDHLKPRQSHGSKLFRHKKEREAMKKFDYRYWDRIDSARRGALNLVSH